MLQTSIEGNVEVLYVDLNFEGVSNIQVLPNQNEEPKGKTYVPIDVQILSKANSDVALS